MYAVPVEHSVVVSTEYLVLKGDFDVVHALAARLMVTNMRVISSNLQQVISDGGEGIILRKPFSIYEQERSTSLIKLKVRTYLQFIV